MGSQLFSKFLGASSKASKNGFDLSQRHVFSAKAGLLLPVFKKQLIPDTTVSLDIRQTLRTDAIETPAFTRMDINYNMYSCRLNDLYSHYDDWAAQSDEHMSALTVGASADELPFFNPYQFFTTRSIGAFNGNTVKISVYIIACLDYMADHPFTCANGDIIKVRDYYIFDQYNNQSVILNMLRTFDMFGYGNYLPVIKLSYKYFVDNILESVFGSETERGTHSFEPFFFINRILAIYPELDEVFPYSVSFPDVDLNVWPFLAYNKIWYDHYRNAYYDNSYYIFSNGGRELEVSDVSGWKIPYVYLYNVDFCISTTEYSLLYNDYNSMFDHVGDADLPAVFAYLISLFSVKPIQYHKDMFTGVLPSTQFGDVSVMTDDRSWLELEYKENISGSSTSHVYTSYGGGGAVSLQAGGGSSQNPAYFRFSPALAISILNQRKAESLQRFNENKLRAANKLKAQFKAHFGVEPTSSLSCESYWHGGFDGQIVLNTVAQTSPSEDAPLGNLGANGVATVQGNKLKISSGTNFTILLGLFSINKPAEYEAYGIDRENQILDKWDLPYSELQNISLKPLDELTLNYMSRINNQGVKILGYLPAFIEHKTAVDKVHGEFFTETPDDDFNGVTGVFHHWVTPRSSHNTSRLAFMYVDPRSVDNIFYKQSLSSQDYDQFYINCQIDMFPTSPLSVIGLPY